MEKKSLQKVYKEIEVPRDSVLDAIRAGKERANHNVPKNNTRKIIWSIVAAATLFISSSFVSPFLSHAMAEVPLVGNVYNAFNDAVGRNLQTQDLITELNQTSSYKGIDVSVTRAYYDGAVIGVTFSVKGSLKTEEDGQVQGFYEIYDGKDGISDSKELVYLQPTENGYTGHIQFSYPKNELPSETTFPLEFKRIGGTEGSWRFDVPINQLPYEIVNVDKGTKKENSEINVHFDSITEGKASTAINYTANFPIQGKHNQVRLEVYDDQGKELFISTDGIDIETTKKDDRIIVKGRSIIPQPIKGKTNYIKIHPKVALTGEDPNEPLELDPIIIDFDK